MHSCVTSHLWLKSALHASSHPCMCTCVLRLGCFLLICPVFYFVPPFSFQPFLMFTSEFNERSRSNPLCDFRLGTVATSDHETPLTEDAMAKPYFELKKFGDLITADHKVLSDNCESRNNHRYAVVVQDQATQWIQAYPCKTKTSQETQRSLQKFLELERIPKVIYTDNSLEFGKACEDLSWNHCTSTPHRSETNGIAERAVRRLREGTSAVLLQSGLNESWWADSMECYTYLRNVTDLLSDGKTPYERRFGQPFKGPIIPFGSLVEYHPITAKDQ